LSFGSPPWIWRVAARPGERWRIEWVSGGSHRTWRSGWPERAGIEKRRSLAGPRMTRVGITVHVTSSAVTWLGFDQFMEEFCNG
jgi:hypothetical protein